MAALGALVTVGMVVYAAAALAFGAADRRMVGRLLRRRGRASGPAKVPSALP
jgi:hypothetical protein